MTLQEEFNIPYLDCNYRTHAGMIINGKYYEGKEHLSLFTPNVFDTQTKRICLSLINDICFIQHIPIMSNMTDEETLPILLKLNKFSKIYSIDMDNNLTLLH